MLGVCRQIHPAPDSNGCEAPWTEHFRFAWVKSGLVLWDLLLTPARGQRGCRRSAKSSGCTTGVNEIPTEARLAWPANTWAWNERPRITAPQIAGDRHIEMRSTSSSRIPMTMRAHDQAPGPERLTNHPKLYSAQTERLLWLPSLCRSWISAFATGLSVHARVLCTGWL